MQYRLKNVIGVPWVEQTVDMAALRIGRKVLHTYLREEMAGSKDPSARAFQVLQEEMLALKMPMSNRLALFRGEVITLLAQLAQTIRRGIDEIVVIDQPICMDVDIGDRVVKVESSIDAIVLRNCKTSNEAPFLLVYMGTMDPTDEMLRYRELKYDLVRWWYGKFVYAKEMPGRFNSTKIIPVELHGKRFSTSLYGSSKSKRDAQEFCSNAIRLIESGIALPVNDPDKCQHCAYSSGCRPVLAGWSKSDVLKVFKEAAGEGPTRDVQR